MKEVIIDVREPDEYKAESIEKSIHIPLSHFDSVAPGTLTHFMDHKIILMCRSGARAKMALDRAIRLGFQPSGGYEVYEGGILEWKKRGNPIAKRKAQHLSILRQTHLAAGLIGLVGTIMGYIIHPGFYLIPSLVGAGLVFAGASGICMMSNVLALAPWNKNVENINQEVCMASTGQVDCH